MTKVAGTAAGDMLADWCTLVGDSVEQLCSACLVAVGGFVPPTQVAATDAAPLPVKQHGSYPSGCCVNTNCLLKYQVTCKSATVSWQRQ